MARTTADKKLGLMGELVTPQPMARIMARARRAVAQMHGAIAKSALPRAFAVERVTRIELAWPAWKAGALPLSYTRVP